MSFHYNGSVWENVDIKMFDDVCDHITSVTIVNYVPELHGVEEVL